ncbi:hypothetical protein GH714_010875 [Hevea brasiliensis]|uniref:Uncharacterized protein n=1 Tax=Hevea brasiliensis TaxID=3981 RepID=A0A6A6NCQ6_HEVBR|nr:hypothetical protein GH714_010875 [Hevea brasiliensis]
MATSSGNEEIAQLIAYRFPSLISKRNIKGDIALHIAARGGMLNTIQTLVCCGKDFLGTDTTSASSSFTSENDLAKSTGDDRLLRIKNVHGNTTLHEAVMNRHHGVALNSRFLQMKKCDLLEEMAKENPELVQLKDENGRTVLHWAADRGNVYEVRFLPSKFSGGLFEMDNKGSFPIHIASERGRVEVTKELLGQWPHQTDLLNIEGQNILHFAAERGKDNVVLARGALSSAGALPNFDLNFNQQKGKITKRRYSLEVERINYFASTVLLLETIVAQ